MRKISSIRFFVFSLLILGFVLKSPAEVTVSVSIHAAPPALPVYVQPECPAPGYMWMPGYWAYGEDDYYWVAGTWVLAPRPGLLWTPGYWGWNDGVYFWHEGYWGRHVGFYGGINYGFGYAGLGYAGGYWREGVFRYNRSVTNVNVTVVHNTYTKVVVNNTATVNRASFNGGAGGVLAKPAASELVAVHEHHVAPTLQQTQLQKQAVSNHELQASHNHGQPPAEALAKSGSGGNAEKGSESKRSDSEGRGAKHGHQRSGHSSGGHHREG